MRNTTSTLQTSGVCLNWRPSSTRLMFPTPLRLQLKKKYTTTSTSRYFEDAIFGAQDTHPDRSISNEIARYLGEQIEARDEKVLQFWKKRVDVYPGLANMAMDLLAIPATSCPSEGVFNKTKRILAPQRTNLSCLHVEALLCVKDWHRVFGPLKIGSHEESD